MNILQINSSLRGANSESNRVAGNIVAKLSAANPGATVIVTTVTNMAWAGLRQVEDDHPAMAAAKAAQ